MIQCPPLKVRTEANVNLNVMCYTYACPAYYQCKENFDMILGESIRHCNATSQWSGEDPICDKKVIMCHLPTANEYSSYRMDSLLVNSVVNYTCLDGFEVIEGDLQRTCLPNQTWSGSAPKCTRKWQKKPFLSFICFKLIPK